MSKTAAVETVEGTIVLGNGTNVPATRSADGVVHYISSGAKGTRKTATEKQASTFVETVVEEKPARKTRAAKPALDVDALTGADELFYSCDMCGADKGARCTQKSGRVKTYFHSSRTKAVEAFTTS